MPVGTRPAEVPTGRGDTASIRWGSAGCPTACANWVREGATAEADAFDGSQGKGNGIQHGVSKEARRTPMRWFRSHRLKVASLALFALVCQFVLSFGHVHLDRFAGNSSNWAVRPQPGKPLRCPPVKSRSPTFRLRLARRAQPALATISARSARTSASRWSSRLARRSCPEFHSLRNCIGRSQPRRLGRSTIFISTHAAPQLSEAMA